MSRSAGSLSTRLKTLRPISRVRRWRVEGEERREGEEARWVRRVERGVEGGEEGEVVVVGWGMLE